MSIEPKQPLATRLTGSLGIESTWPKTAIAEGEAQDQFAMQAAIDNAQHAIDCESTIVLTRRESIRLLEMIETPPASKPAFRTGPRAIFAHQSY